MVELRAEGISLSYGEVDVLEDVSFRLEGGERLAIVGPNGAGKSSLLKVLLGLVAADAGSVRVDGEDGVDGRRAVAYLPQRVDVDLDYPAQVREVVAMGRYPHTGAFRRLRDEDHAAIERALAEVDLQPLARRRVSALSGGQRRRMFLARALAQEPRILLLDEPYAGIDYVAEQIIEDRLESFRIGGGIVLLVNHDLVSVKAREQRLLLLLRRVIADGPPAAVLRPEPLARAYGGTPALLQDPGAGR